MFSLCYFVLHAPFQASLRQVGFWRAVRLVARWRAVSLCPFDGLCKFRVGLGFDGGGLFSVSFLSFDFSISSSVVWSFR